MKQMKRFFSIILAFLILALCVPVAFSEETTCAVGDLITFGSYPQTRVDETPALKAGAESAKWASYEYYSGTGSFDGNMQPGDWMQFADFFVGSEKYRAVMFTQYRPFSTNMISDASNSYQDDNGYSLNSVYYFKYEPLTWRVLDPSTGYIMCEYLIDVQAYQNKTFFSEDSHVSWQDS